MSNRRREERTNPTGFILGLVVLIILAGALLLMLPWASSTGRGTPPLTALFMATSAICVTGHSLVDLSSYFSLYGQVVLLILCQVGGLGFMTMATFFLSIAGRRLSLQNEMFMMESLRIGETNELQPLLRQAVILTFLAEGLGTLIITLRLMTGHGLAGVPALYQGLFHAVSAFCNAGFTLYPDSLIIWREDKIILLTLVSLMVLGGLGFLVIRDCGRGWFWRRKRLSRGRLSLHSRVVLYATAALLIGGGLLLAALEWHKTLADLSLGDRLTCALFQSAATRTAGFDVVGMAHTHEATRLVIMNLMFIGGSPGSVTGGIKTTTFVILLCAMLAMLRGRQQTTLWGRSIAVPLVEKALAIFLLGVMMIVAIYGLLLVTEAQSIIHQQFTASGLLFEVVATFGTVGLTTEILPALTPLGKSIIILGMFIGRYGPLTIALLVGSKETRQLLRYPEEDIMVG